MTGRSTCSSGIPAAGRIDSRGPATSRMPGETTRSTSRSSSDQARRRSECPTRSGWLVTATTSASNRSTADRASSGKPKTGTPSRCDDSVHRVSRLDTHAATTSMPCPGAFWICAMRSAAESARPITTVRCRHWPRDRMQGEPLSQHAPPDQAEHHRSGNGDDDVLPGDLELADVRRQCDDRDQHGRGAGHRAVLLGAHAQVARLVAVGQGHRGGPHQRHGERRERVLVRRHVTEAGEVPQGPGQGGATDVQTDRRPAVPAAPGAGAGRRLRLHGDAARRPLLRNARRLVLAGSSRENRGVVRPRLNKIRHNDPLIPW